MVYRGMLRRLFRWIFLLLVSGLATLPVLAQYSLGDLRLTAFGGPAVHTGASGHPLQMGLSADLGLVHPGHESLGVGFLVEGGFFRPALSGTGNYYFSGDAMLAHVQPDRATAEMTLHPFAVAGYTQFFNATSTMLSTAPAMNFGVGVDRFLGEDLWLRLEVREHYTPGSDMHALVFRIGLVGVASLR
jgi:hypothetical protein